MVESIGVWLPSKLVTQGFMNLIWKCRNIMNVVEEEGVKYKGNYMAIDYVLKGESHTMGNIIQEWIYNKEFKNSVDGQKLSHVSYHEPHPLENAVIIRLVLKQAPKHEITDFVEYRKQTNTILIEHLKSLCAHLEHCSTVWKSNEHPTQVSLVSDQ